MTDSKLTASQLDQLKLNYAEMIVEGMDMDSPITFAVESIEKNQKTGMKMILKKKYWTIMVMKLEGLMENLQ